MFSISIKCVPISNALSNTCRLYIKFPLLEKYCEILVASIREVMLQGSLCCSLKAPSGIKKTLQTQNTAVAKYSLLKGAQICIQ